VCIFTDWSNENEVGVKGEANEDGADKVIGKHEEEKREKENEIFNNK
jgi:hypothetical protein